MPAPYYPISSPQISPMVTVVAFITTFLPILDLLWDHALHSFLFMTLTFFKTPGQPFYQLLLYHLGLGHVGAENSSG